MSKFSSPIVKFIILILLSFIVASNAQAGKVYRWVDKSGKTHFSQTPPSADTREYDVRFAKEKSLPEPVKDIKNTGKDGDTKAKDEKAEKKEAAKTPQQRLAEIEKARAEQAKIATEKAKQRDERLKKCKQAQSNMRNIEQGGRIYDVDKDGNRLYWDDSKRASKKTETQELVEKFCN